MRPIDEEGFLQLVAGTRLMCISGLLDWDKENHKFTTPAKSFDIIWKKLDDTFGRVVLWNSFSAGAEFFFKGFVLANGHEFREPVVKLTYPPGEVDKEWIERVLRQEDRNSATDFKTFGYFTTEFLAAVTSSYRNGTGTGFVDEFNLVCAAKTVLARNIRNRDAHAYIPNVRNNHLYLVEALFIPAFNIMLNWLPPLATGSGLPPRMTKVFEDTKGFVAGMAPY